MRPKKSHPSAKNAIEAIGNNDLGRLMLLVAEKPGLLTESELSDGGGLILAVAARSEKLFCWAVDHLIARGEKLETEVALDVLGAVLQSMSMPVMEKTRELLLALRGPESSWVNSPDKTGVTPLMSAASLDFPAGL